VRFSIDNPYSSRRSPVFARNMVATSQPLATAAGLAMLRAGGNAVDAALAAAITLTVLEPTGNGLGSDAFCILWDGRELHGLNASGRSPKAWTRERFGGATSMPRRGWDSVTIPGAVSAWRDLSQRFGKLPFEKLFAPAIDCAERGFLVSPIIAEQWGRGARELASQPGFAACFMPGGRAPAAGELNVNAAQARSLKLIAETKGEAFYTGELAERIAGFAKEHGAALTLEDLAAHRNNWSGTISQDFGPVTLHEIPPNGQGIAALMALGLLAHSEIATLQPDSLAAFHLQIEAMKLAFADVATFVADHEHMRTTTVEHLLDPGYLKSRARLIDTGRAQRFGAGAPKDGGTVCLSAADENGMMVSYIQSNYAGFGSGVVVPGTGISLQNRGYGFTLEQGHPNEVAGGKRPFHTIIPGFVMRGREPAMAFGLMGGPMQAQGHVQMVLRTQIWGQDPQVASDAPRWRVVEGVTVALETGVPEDVLAGLAQLGHEVVREAPEASFGFGGAQLIQKIAGGYVAGSDSRKDGHAAGF
jgi:gamma-glutamyltranspeptidase/glutathione hydrolase